MVGEYEAVLQPRQGCCHPTFSSPWPLPPRCSSFSPAGSLIISNNTLLPGVLLRAADTNIQPSFEQCALSCRETANCSGES